MFEKTNNHANPGFFKRLDNLHRIHKWGIGKRRVKLGSIRKPKVFINYSHTKMDTGILYLGIKFFLGIYSIGCRAEIVEQNKCVTHKVKGKVGTGK